MNHNYPRQTSDEAISLYRDEMERDFGRIDDEERLSHQVNKDFAGSTKEIRQEDSL